jgi:threonine dehydrogenase-like Zn-dependent dehydrogenase
MRGFLVSAPGRHAVTDLPEPVAGPGEVLVAPVAVGICGSDVELLAGTRPTAYVRYPIVPGHEWAGRVVAVGPGVPGVRPGAAVVAEGVRSCGTCARCAEGRNNLCDGPYAETGFTHPGALAQRLVVPVGQVHVLPDDRPTAPAALIEPAACVATGLLEVGQPPAGSRVAIVGDGPLGLLAVILLRLTSPAELTLVGSRLNRAQRAYALGATDVTSRDNAAFHKGRYDLVVGATNSPSGAMTVLRLARRAGTVILLDISGSGTPALDPDTISLGHLRVQGVFAASRAAWQWLVKLYGAGVFDPAPLITHRFPLDETAQAFAVLADRDSGAIKVVIQPDGIEPSGADAAAQLTGTGR